MHNLFLASTRLERFVDDDDLRDVILDGIYSYKKAEGALLSSIFFICRRDTPQLGKKTFNF